MVKPYWVIVGFGVGLLTGIIVARKISTEPSTNELKIAAPAAVQAENPRVDAAPEAGLQGTTAKPAGEAPAAAAAPVPAAPPPSAEPPATPGLASTPVKAAPSPFAASIDSGVVRSIDVGEVLAKQIARPSEPGYENLIGDAHRELEREPRDERWAYEMEGELQNSLVSQASMGDFKVEHVECRATICEVRLSGRADRQAGLQQWSESLRSSGLDKRLFPNMSSSVGTDDRFDALYILRRPRR
jgi:hypothetical protein